MGGFALFFVAVFSALLVMLITGGSDNTIQKALLANQPGIQAVAGNMVSFHQAAVDFVSRTENRNPVAGTWSFSYTGQAPVRCSASYAGGTYDTGGNATTPDCTGDTSDFRLPSFASQIYNWQTFYQSDGAGGSPDIVVTYAAASTDSIGGYTSAMIASGLTDYGALSTPHLYFGITPASGPLTLTDQSGASLTLPAGFTTRGVVALATVIP